MITDKYHVYIANKDIRLIGSNFGKAVKELMAKLNKERDKVAAQYPEKDTANQKAGEFGHIILVPGGKQCYCGKRGCADVYCAASALTDDTSQTLEQFMQQLEERKESAQQVWQEYLEYLAVLISNLRMAYDMDIILGGEVGGYLSDYMIPLEEKVMKYNGFDHDARYLKICSYKREASAVGVAKYFLQEFIKDI